MREISFGVAAVLALLAAPVAAQTPNFGDNSNQWANDGECDDPRFQGPGMASFVTDTGIGTDANDCRALFNSGRITLIGGSATVAPGKTPPGQQVAGSVHPSGIDFGDDMGEYANDGECDDRRFYGMGMTGFGVQTNMIGHDASDCMNAYNAGSIALWDAQAAANATSCQSIDFGADTGDFTRDGECDDFRFEGRGTANFLYGENNFTDATDCRAHCSFGTALLRDY